MIETPIRLDRAQTVIFETIRDEITASVGWAFGSPSFGEEFPEEHVSIQTLGGPTARTRRNGRGRVILPIETLEVTITDVTPKLRPIIRLNGFDFGTDIVGGDTIDKVRDRLIAAIEDDTLEPVSASIVDADTLLLTADRYAAIQELYLVGPLAAGAAVKQAPARRTRGSALMPIQITVYSKKKEIFDGALSVAARIEALFQTPDLLERLIAFGVGVVDIGAPLDSSEIAGARWETRSSIDIMLSLWASWARPVDAIEAAQVTQISRDLTGAQIESRTFEVQP